jgi:hypothetical protein
VSEGSKEKPKYRDTNNIGMNKRLWSIPFRTNGTALFIGLNSTKEVSLFIKFKDNLEFNQGL